MGGCTCPETTSVSMSESAHSPGEKKINLALLFDSRVTGGSSVLLCCHPTWGTEGSCFIQQLPQSLSFSASHVPSTAGLFLTFLLCLVLQGVSVSCEAQGGRLCVVIPRTRMFQSPGKPSLCFIYCTGV